MYNKRIIILFFILMAAMSSMMIRIFYLSKGTNLSQAASRQNTYKLEVFSPRGNIYDCNMDKLISKKYQNFAAIFPSTQASQKVSTVLSQKDRKNILKCFSSGKPFLFNLKEKSVVCEDVDIFKVPIRYSDYQLAPHVIGYMDDSKRGIYGIEKSYNEYLSLSNTKTEVKYKVDATNNILEGAKKQIEDNSYMGNKGVVLTIDSKIQEIAQIVARKSLKKGTVLVTEVPSCKIKAAVSMPDFSPNDLADALESGDSPLLNRILLPYNIGSIFKLLTASAALEHGLDPEKIYECNGQIKVDGKNISCSGGRNHGKINLNEAIAHSCNGYFVDISRPLPPKYVLDTAKNFGFGSEIELAPSLTSEAGVLPEISNLYDNIAMANFSFGQGELMVTPLQVSGFINTIASMGEYRKPKLVEGLVDENFKFKEKFDDNDPKRVISNKTSEILKKAMASAVEYGTAVKGKPENVTAAAKTATAETGILKEDGNRTIQAWFAGFFPLDHPKYSIVVLAEDGNSGGENCGPVFKQIAENMYKNIPEYFKD